MSLLVSGIFLQVSDKFHEGDLIALADKSVVGVITKIGWIHTLVRGEQCDGVIFCSSCLLAVLFV
jgi:small-conductance mechanosensitive channel